MSQGFSGGDKHVKIDSSDKFTGYSVKLKKKVNISNATLHASKTTKGNWKLRVVGDDGHGTAVHAFIGIADPKVKKYLGKLGI